jgi:small-conductance mechanosensitive channel
VLGLRLLDLLDPAVDLLSAPLFSLLGQQVSLLLLLQVALVLVVAFVLASLIGRVLEDRVLPGLGIESGAGTAVSTGMRYLLVAVGLLVALETAGFDFAVLAVFAGALGIGAGFGLQRFASNLVSGLVMIFGRVVRRGDVVTVGGQIGMIQEVGIRATVLKDLDNIEFIVPNDNLINETIINWTYSDSTVRLHLPVGVSYGSDPEKVRETLLEVAAAHPQVKRRPAPTVWFVGYGDSSIDFELLAWMDIKRISRKQLASDLYFAAFRALKETGIEIPFPQRDLHLKTGWAERGGRGDVQAGPEGGDAGGGKDGG